MRVALLLALGLGIPSAGAADKIPGVGLDYFPGKPDPYASGSFDRDAFIARYGEGPEMQQYWPGMVAELFFINELALRNACLAGALGDPAVYDCMPKMVEQLDLAKATRRPYFIQGEPGENILYQPDNFYCKWWVNQGIQPGRTPQNPIEVTDTSRPAGPFHTPPETGWACPVYKVNVLPEETGCVQDGDTLCLAGRFEVEAVWQIPAGASGSGQATRLTTDTGTFSFFDAKNLEIFVKVVDGCTVNQSFWIFASGLTNVRVDLKVKDTQTGQERTYVNPLNQPYLPLQQTSDFPCS